jgi:Flp pilus assembly protein TadB
LSIGLSFPHHVKFILPALFPLSLSLCVCLYMSATAGQTTSTSSAATTTTSEEVILALQRERKNQWESFKKFGEFRNMSSSTTKRGGRGGKLTALGYLYACISAIVFLLYWFVDAVDGRYASLLLLASCFVVRVHPAFNSSNGKLK